MKKIILYILFFVLFVFALRLVLSQKSKQAIQKTSPEHTVEARQLFAEFYRDEAGANEKYLNKTIAVSGEVAEVIKDSKGNLSVMLAGGDPDAAVKCVLDKQQENQLKEFHAGQKVKFKCVCSGYLGHVELVQCVEWD